MRTRWLTVSLALPVILAAASLPRRPSFEDVRLHLFCQGTGELTEDVGSAPDIHRWNTVTGEGGAPCASTSTLVVFVIRGDPDTSLGDYPLHLVVTRDARDLRDREELARDTIRLGTTSEDGTLFVPYLVQDTGCTPVWIGATIGSAPPSIRTLIPFRCDR
ncbi:MAG: hypothetical protein PVJ02_01445 [Gemmatimonadota bacterium]|jgi:hypothetical protein